MTFARTKIQPPRVRTGLVDRSALETRLADALATRRAALLCAPAGYGKTTLLARALARLPADCAVAWISADEGDDLLGVLECLLEALEPFDPPWRSAPQNLLQRAVASDAEWRAVAAELINALEACEVGHGVIVIDDLHRIEDPALFGFLDALLERIGARWSLAFASRIEPPLALARMRAAGELAEFRQLQLRFAQDEARRLARERGLDAAHADRAFERTQGWPAGLGMAIGSAMGQPAGQAWREGERSILEYLLAEVLDRQREELADFLLSVSVLHELDAERCAAVSGRVDAAALLDEIERMGLLSVSLDAPTPVLRLHDLLREALQQRLALRAPARLRELRRRAAGGEPDAMRRIALLIAAGDLGAAASLVLAAVPERLARTGPTSVQHLLNAFPAAFREESPQLLLVRGLVGWVGWDFVAMLDLFERARRTFEAAGDTAGASLAGAYSAHGLIMAGHLAEAETLLHQLDGRSLPLDTRALVLNGLYWLAIDQGRMFDVAAIHAEQLELLQRSRNVALAYQSSPPLRLPGLRGVTRNLARHGDWLLEVGGEEPTPLRPLGILSHAWVAAWHGRIREAHALREQARAEAAWSGGSGAVMAHLLTHAAFAFTMSGQKAEAMAAARERAARQRHTGTWSAYILATLNARITAACGEPAELRQALAEARSIAARLQSAGTRPSEILLEPATAQLAWLEGRTGDAIRQWRHALRDEAAMDVYGQAAETRVRLAFTLLRRGETAEASHILQPAIDTAQAEEAPGGLLLAGTALRELACANWRGHLPGKTQQLLRDWAGMLEAVDEAPAGTDAGLSPRELEVLAHIAAGDSNKHIARALDLSPHTVKRHVANILGKLGVETRGQAAASYQALLR